MREDTAEPLEFEIHLSEPELADGIAAWAAEHGETLVPSEERGIVPLLPFVLAGLLAINSIASLIMWVRSKTTCRTIIDARDDELRTDIDCRIRDGRIIVIANDDTRVEVTDAPPMLDLTKVLASALGGTAASMVSVLETTGASARILD
jgi:hypothetical protein